jgi:phosphomannomutase
MGAQEVEPEEKERFAALAARMFETVEPAVVVYSRTRFANRREETVMRRKLAGHLVALLENYFQFWQLHSPDTNKEKDLARAVHAEILLMEHLDVKRDFEQILLRRLKETQPRPRPYYPYFARSKALQDDLLYLTGYIEEMHLDGYSDDSIRTVRDQVMTAMLHIADGMRAYATTYHDFFLEDDIVHRSLEKLISIVYGELHGAADRSPEACAAAFRDFTDETVMGIAEKLRRQELAKHREAAYSPPISTPVPIHRDPQYFDPPMPSNVSSALRHEQKLQPLQEILFTQMTKALLDTERQVLASVKSGQPLSDQSLDILERELRRRTDEEIRHYRAEAEEQGMSSKSVEHNARELVDHMVRETRQSAALALIESPRVRDVRTQLMAEIAQRHARRSTHNNVYFSRKDGVKYLTYDLLHLLKHFSLAPLLAIYSNAAQAPYLLSLANQIGEGGHEERLAADIQADVEQFIRMSDEILDWLTETHELSDPLTALRADAAALFEQGIRLHDSVKVYMTLYSKTVLLVETFGSAWTSPLPWTKLDEAALTEMYHKLKLTHTSELREWIGPDLRELPENQFTRLVFASIPGNSFARPSGQIVTVGGEFYSWMGDEALRHYAIGQKLVAAGDQWQQLHTDAAMVSALLFRIGGITKVLVLNERSGALNPMEAEDQWQDLLARCGIQSEDIIRVDREPDGAEAFRATTLAEENSSATPLVQEEPEGIIRSFRETLADALGDDGKFTLVLDYDDTVELARQPLSSSLETIIAHLKAGHRLGILSGGSLDRVEKNFFAPLLAALPKEDRWILKNLRLGPDNGSQIYRFNVETEKLECIFSVDIREEVGPERYPKIAEIIQSSVDELGHRAMLENVMGWTFDDAQWKALRSTFVDPRTADDGKVSQITFFALGIHATNEQKKLFDERGGKQIRKAYETFITRELQKIGIALAVKVSGQSSIDLTLPGIDKAFGLMVMSFLFSTPLRKIIFIGDAFQGGQNDEAAFKAAGIVGNVGALVDLIRSRYYKPGIKFFQLPLAGPAGFRQFALALQQAA